MIRQWPKYLHWIFPAWVSAFACWPFVFILKKERTADQILLNHERIHLRQQIELLILPFYLIYLTEYLVLLIKHQNRQKAYRSISFEQEAFEFEASMDYLKRRKFLAMWR